MKFEQVVNCVRFLSVDAIERAKSGHPGLPMGGASMALTLWSEFMQHNPDKPDWENRDRFVLSAGHGSMLLYSLLHLFGYGVSIDDLQNFRQWGSITPGHPEYGMTPGVETTTGPLGQGFANAVGMAIAEKRLGAEFNRPGFDVVDHYTWVYAGDGCLMEGISYEAASLAGHLKLGKLICLYDDNEITIDGSTDLTFTEDVGQRFEAMGWQVLRVEDGNDVQALSRAIVSAKAEGNKPSLVMVRTVIGYGSPNKAGKAAAHGAPLGPEEVELARKELGWHHAPFHVPQEVQEYFVQVKEGLEQGYLVWQSKFEEWAKAYPQLAAKWQKWHSGEMDSTNLDIEFTKAVATRTAAGKVLQQVAHHNGNLMGGSADLNGSTMTYMEGKGDFGPENPQGSNIFFGIREHAMAAICNGIVLHGGLRAFCSTFLVFSDYLKPALRLSALSHLPVVYVFTHDSIGVGEDGPTHQPVEHLAMLRSVPNVDVIRPADGREAVEAWKHALERKSGPTVLVLSRQNLPQLEGSGAGLARGGYVLSQEQGKADVVFIATGSEVQLAVEAAKVLAQEGMVARVVSMPCRELFLAQDGGYRDQVLPPGVPRIVVEAGLSLGWEGLAGPEGRIICLDRFGASAPGPIVMEKLGFSVDNLVKAAKEATEGRSRCRK